MTLKLLSTFTVIESLLTGSKKGSGRPHEIIHWGRERDENQVTVSVRIGDGEPDVWLGFHPEASLSVMRLVKFVLADG